MSSRATLNFDDYQVNKAVEQMNGEEPSTFSKRCKLVTLIIGIIVIVLLIAIIIIGVVLRSKEKSDPTPTDNGLKALVKDLILYYENYKSEGEIEYHRI